MKRLLIVSCVFKLNSHVLTTCCDTVGATIVSTFKSTVGSTGSIARAECGIPGVSGVAVGIAVCSLVMNPSPIRINDNFALLSRARGSTSSSTLLPGHRRMSLGLVSTDLLRTRGSE